MLVASAGSAESPEDVTTPGRLFAPRELDVLVGRRGDVAEHRHRDNTVEDDGVFDSGHMRLRGRSRRHSTDRGDLRLPLLDPPVHERCVYVFEVVLRGPRSHARERRGAHASRDLLLLE